MLIYFSLNLHFTIKKNCFSVSKLLRNTDLIFRLWLSHDRSKPTITHKIKLQSMISEFCSLVIMSLRKNNSNNINHKYTQSLHIYAHNIFSEQKHKSCDTDQLTHWFQSAESQQAKKKKGQKKMHCVSKTMSAHCCTSAPPHTQTHKHEIMRDFAGKAHNVNYSFQFQTEHGDRYWIGWQIGK